MSIENVHLLPIPRSSGTVLTSSELMKTLNIHTQQNQQYLFEILKGNKFLRLQIENKLKCSHIFDIVKFQKRAIRCLI